MDSVEAGFGMCCKTNMYVCYVAHANNNNTVIAVIAGGAGGAVFNNNIRR